LVELDYVETETASLGFPKFWYRLNLWDGGWVKKTFIAMAMQRVTMASFAPDRISRTTMVNGGEDLGILNSKILPTENVRLAVF
jgi:hypothetical protein